MELKICHLYPELMNIYGDRGNVIALSYRAKLHGIKVDIKNISLGEKINPKEFDFIFIGGGEDKQQQLVASDFQKIKGSALKEAADSGKVILGICGGYQLFGKYYKPAKGPELPGINLMDIYTVAGEKRMIGNVVIKSIIESDLNLPEIIGFENHSGKTYLGNNIKPLGKVEIGFGNNGEDKTEGAIWKNVFGTYLHGSLLPKNPHLTDFLLQQAIKNKYKDFQLKELPTKENELEILAHKRAIERANGK